MIITHLESDAVETMRRVQCVYQDVLQIWLKREDSFHA